MSQTGSSNCSALSPKHRVEMPCRNEPHGDQRCKNHHPTPVWSPGVRTDSLAVGICTAVVLPPLLELTLLSRNFRQDSSLT